jgi:hypothetical protein
MRLIGIRQDQIATLQWDRQRELRTRYIARLTALAPEKTASVSDEALHRFCDSGITRANAYDLTQEEAVYAFIAAMMMLGSDFDHRPEHAWAPELLGAPAMEQELKAKHLRLRILIDTRKDIARHD